MQFVRFIIFFTFLGSSIIAAAQVVHAYEIGDTFYRYGCNLHEDMERFRSIRLQYLDFPCTEEFVVHRSDKANTSFELHSNMRKEFYLLKGQNVGTSGYETEDPFLEIPHTTINFDHNIPLVRSGHRDDFYNKTESSFYINYKARDLSGEIKIWCEKNDVSELRLLCNANWTSSYKFNDVFDNLQELVEGYVIDNKITYSVQTLEIKGVSWEVYDFRKDRVLADNFANKSVHYMSFYDFRSLAEVARINFSPSHSFQYNQLTRIPQLPGCTDNASQIYVFPNPTYGVVNLKITNAQPGTYVFTVVNIIGKSLWTENISVLKSTKEVKLRIPELSKGVYLYGVKDPKGKRIQSRRLIFVDP